MGSQIFLAKLCESLKIYDQYMDIFPNNKVIAAII